MIAISLARDGLNFRRSPVTRLGAPEIRNECRVKSTGRRYPHFGVAGGRLWVIHPATKVDTEVARVPILELHEI